MKKGGKDAKVIDSEELCSPIRSGEIVEGFSNRISYPIVVAITFLFGYFFYKLNIMNVFWIISILIFFVILIIFYSQTETFTSSKCGKTNGNGDGAGAEDNDGDGDEEDNDGDGDKEDNEATEQPTYFPDRDSYVPKTQIPSCPDMSNYVHKDKVPDMSQYILKASIPACHKTTTPKYTKVVKNIIKANAETCKKFTDHCPPNPQIHESTTSNESTGSKPTGSVVPVQVDAEEDNYYKVPYANLEKKQKTYKVNVPVITEHEKDTKNLDRYFATKMHPVC